MDLDRVKTIAYVLQGLVLLTGLFAYFLKGERRKTAVIALLTSCTLLSAVVLGASAIKPKDDKGSALMDVGQAEFSLRFCGLSDAMAEATGLDAKASGKLPGPVSGLLTQKSDQLEKLKEAAEKGMEAAVRKDPQSLSYRYKQIFMLGENGKLHKSSLAAFDESKDKQAPEVKALLSAMFFEKKIAAGAVEHSLKLAETLAPSGTFRALSRIRIYECAGLEKEARDERESFRSSSVDFAIHLIFLGAYLIFSVLVGLIVILVQFILLPRSLSATEDFREIQAPVDYGFARVYGVFVGWLALECMLSPLVVKLLPQIKGIASSPALVAIVTMAIYLITNLPALLLAWFIAIKPFGLKFFEAVKLRASTPRRKMPGLIAAGLLTWFACVPLVVVASLAAKFLLKAQGSSNPILAVVMDAARSPNIVNAALFVLAIGVLPAFCEEILFRGFLYTALRKRLGALLSMLISAAIFAGIHVDPGAFPQLFVLGFAFAFVFERTRSLIPNMIAHCLWNSGTFMLMMIIFGS